MPITKEQAFEIAEYYIVHTGNMALRDNIAVSRSNGGWAVWAITTPVILGQKTEMLDFSIDADTGEVGVCISEIVIPEVVQDTIRKIREKEGLDKQEKEKLEAKVKEVEKEINKRPIDKKKMDGFRKWFKNNASWLTALMSLISTILSKLP